MLRDTVAQKDRINKRNNSIRLKFTEVRKKNPKWTIIAIIEDVADGFFLSPSTVTKILKEYNVDVPAVDTVAKYTKQHHLN